MKLNFKIRSVLGCYVLCAPVFALAQGSLNIHRTGSPPVVQVNMAEIDSVVNQLEPPPAQLRVHRTDGSVQAFPFSIIDSVTYSPAGPEGAGLVATMTTQSVLAMVANCRGYVGDIGGSPVTARGICYGTSPLPDLGTAFVTVSGSTGAFNAQVVGLAPGTSYYARAFVTNAQGTSYGNQISFTTLSGDHLNADIIYGSMSDQDGNTYATVTIGSQVWMAENLRATTYANGDPIPNVTDAGQWSTLSSGAWCDYGNNATLADPYGKLYNWFAVMDPRKVCPNGWHAPTDLEWQAFELELGVPVEDLDLVQNRGAAENVGNNLKSAGPLHWVDSDLGTNASGFSGLPAGYRSYTGGFAMITLETSWWSSTAGGSGGWIRELFYGQSGIDRGFNSDRTGHSVRCLMD
ncbi:MAG TPA: fibrobacter succinogenes major paralogous domain-containing protein [Flavobacteriales bacterium]|nr:fibrobacter succinogenes major paralogous domain-containing protein [Flavobacteriales bacterium]